MSKYVYLDSKHHEYVVENDTYEQISALVQAGKLCTAQYGSFHTYSLENPCVGKGICLQHTMLKHPFLSLLDTVGTNTDGQRIYRFIDVQGMVYSSIEDSSEQPSKDMSETLNYHGFTPPIKIEGRGGKSVGFHTYYASLYGNLLSASVIVLVYNHTSEKIRGLYLLYKNGPTKELSKKGELYHRADELVEATKDQHGQYHVNDNPHFSKWESDTYAVISQLESAMYDVTLKLQNGNHKQEEESVE